MTVSKKGSTTTPRQLTRAEREVQTAAERLTVQIEDALAAITVTAVCLAIPLFPSYWPVAIAQVASGAASAVFPPAIAAITLGLVGHAAFTRRTGRNEAWNHAGNAFAALGAGALSLWWGPIAVFALLGAMADETRIAPAAERQRECIEQDGFARAGLAGQHREATGEFDIEPFDQDDVTDRQTG